MLPLSRRLGTKVFIGDKPVTLKALDSKQLILEYEGTDTVVPKHELVTFDSFKVIYSKRRGSYAMILFSSPHPIFREEVYEQRKLNKCGKVQQSMESPNQ